LSPLPWDVEENLKEKAKLVGWDKNILTEQQMEKKIATTILTKEYTECNFSHHLMLSSLSDAQLTLK